MKEQRFKAVKVLFLEPPLLAHLDPKGTLVSKFDTLDFVVGEVLFQLQTNGMEHLIG